MMANCYELDSFVTKFRYLCSAGYDATLTLSSEKGQAQVSFNVNLGSLPPPLTLPPPAPIVSSATPCQRRRSPSYYRRLKRRSESRLNLDSTFVSASTKCAEETGKVISDEAENATEHMNNSYCRNNAITEVEEISAVHPPNTLSDDLGCDNDLTENCSNAGKCDENEVSISSGQAVMDQELDVDEQLKKRDDAADVSLQKADNMKNAYTYSQYDTGLHYPLPKLDFLKF